jgi:acyl-CoA reductase-like NAD-dependent aldehyde dehydrogenase
MNEVPRIHHLIGGQERPAQQYREVRDPGRLDQVVAEVALGTDQDVADACEAAHAAYPAWRDTPVADRAALVAKAGEVYAGCAAELAPLLCREHGGVMWEAETDFGAGGATLTTTAAEAERLFTPTVLEDDDSRITIRREPRGVMAAIVPWNMPLVLTAMKVAPALTTGNTMVVKPSSSAPAATTLTLMRIAELFPPGVLNVVNGSGSVGSAMAAHPLVRKVGFTGGTEVGRTVMATAAAGIRNVTLELGGNDAAIVLPDADIETALDRMLVGVFTRSGQICFAVKRIYVHQSRFQEFLAAMVARVEKMTVGHGVFDGNPTFGPVHNADQMTSVTNLIEQTKAAGCRVLQLGAKANPDQWDNGYYILPHIVVDPDESQPVVTCEQFGPVIPVMSFKTEDEAIARANDSEFGLCSSVWTTDLEHGFELATRIEAGSTFVNQHSLLALDLRAPFGGVKQSGIGREYGIYAMEEYTDYHTIRVMKK